MLVKKKRNKHWNPKEFVIVLRGNLGSAKEDEIFADLISFGVLFLANPDLPERFRRNTSLNDPDRHTFYGGDGKEEEFIQLWNETAYLMKKEPGFIDTKLHRSLDPGARFQFVNIAHWESQQTWQQAIAANPGLKDWWQKIAVLAQANPALYQVEAQY